MTKINLKTAMQALQYLRSQIVENEFIPQYPNENRLMLIHVDRILRLWYDKHLPGNAYGLTAKESRTPWVKSKSGG